MPACCSDRAGHWILSTVLPLTMATTGRSLGSPLTSGLMAVSGAAGRRWDAANGDAAQGVPQLDPFRRCEQRDLDLPADPTAGHQDRLIVSAYLNLGGNRLRIGESVAGESQVRGAEPH